MYRFPLLVAVLVLFLSGTAAPAQTPANVSIVSGNGQLICGSCAFEPLIVKVTDAGGNPVPNVAVTWTQSAGSNSFQAQTTTGSDASSNASLCNRIGQSCNFILPGTPTGAPAASTFVASVGNAAATFIVTQGPAGGTGVVTPQLISPAVPATLTGAAGASGAAIQVQVITNTAQPVPNVSVRLAPEEGTTPAISVSCTTQAGADPGSVLTDSTGLATCTPVFGAGGGTGDFRILVGGVPASTSSGLATYYAQYRPIHVTITANAPANVTVVSGNNQTATSGQSLASPLVAKITDSSNAALASQTVTWTVSPANAATLTNTSTTSDSSGQVSTGLTLSSTASGTLQVTVATSNAKSASFTITAAPPVQISTLQKVSGDQQSAVVNTVFSQSLVVQASTTSGPAAGVAVQFTLTGPATLTPASATTGADGKASVTIAAGTTPGTVTVTATAGSLTQTFTLTVVPQGPSISATSFLNGAGFGPTTAGNRSALSPCSIGALLNGKSLTAAPPLPYVFASPPLQSTTVSITFPNSDAAPVYYVSSDQSLILFQVPCDVPPGSVSVTVQIAGASSTVSNVAVAAASPGIFEFTDSDGTRRAIAVRPDGSFVTANNPARRGETIRLLATGLGPTSPPASTGAIPTPGVDALVTYQGIMGVNNAGAPLDSIRLAPNLVGVYEVAFQVPSTAPQNSNVVISLEMVPVGCSTIDCTQLSNGGNGSRIAIQ